ncbi:hypothetical protein D9M69_724280 [compost metagenome]
MRPGVQDFAFALALAGAQADVDADACGRSRVAGNGLRCVVHLLALQGCNSQTQGLRSAIAGVAQRFGGIGQALHRVDDRVGQTQC